MKRTTSVSISPIMGAIVTAGIALCMSTFFGGCGDDDDDADGTSILTGTVESFENVSVAGRVLAAVSDVAVSIQGPASRSTTTDTDGVFKFSNIPAGRYSIQFTHNGQTAVYPSPDSQSIGITTYDGQQTELRSIHISGETVGIGGIDVTPIGITTETTDNTEINNGQQETQQQDTQQQSEDASQDQVPTAENDVSVSSVSYSGARDLWMFFYPDGFLDVNSDGVTDFRFEMNLNSEAYLLPQVDCAAVGLLSFGTRIDASNPSSGWFSNRLMIAKWLITHSEPPESACAGGAWCGASNAYVGLSFPIAGDLHYGWVRISITQGGTGTIHDWAYQTQAGASIQAGQTE